MYILIICLLDSNLKKIFLEAKIKILWQKMTFTKDLITNLTFLKLFTTLLYTTIVQSFFEQFINLIC